MRTRRLVFLTGENSCSPLIFYRICPFVLLFSPLFSCLYLFCAVTSILNRKADPSSPRIFYFKLIATFPTFLTFTVFCFELNVFPWVTLLAKGNFLNLVPFNLWRLSAHSCQTTGLPPKAPGTLAACLLSQSVASL